MRLFSAALDLLFPPRETERLVRAAAPDALALLAAPASSLADGMESVSLLSYRLPLVHAAVVEAKFRGNGKAQALLGETLADFLLERAAELVPFAGRAALVPVPLSRERRRERGYNQAEEICRAALPRLRGAAFLDADAIARVRDTRPQTELSGSERRRNLEGAFRAARRLPPGTACVLVDDVVTTGATLAAAARALKDAGAASVLAVALAR